MTKVMCYSCFSELPKDGRIAYLSSIRDSMDEYSSVELSRLLGNVMKYDEDDVSKLAIDMDDTVDAEIRSFLAIDVERRRALLKAAG
ncbi:MAG: hypothetical protein ABIF08_02345 [Nanoarchaeota archaeon]